MKSDDSKNNIDRDNFEQKYLFLVIENIKRIKESKNLTLEDLAALSGLSDNHLSKICCVTDKSNRVPSLPTLFKIAYSLGVSPDELLLEHNKPD